MKSSSKFLFIAMAGMAILAAPAKTHALSPDSDNDVLVQEIPVESIPVESIPVDELSMESFRAGTLDREGIRKLADSCIAAGQFQKADELFEKLLLLYPLDEEILKKAILTYETLTNAEKALPLYDKLLKRHPKDSRLTVKAARANLWTGRTTTALKLYEMVVNAGIASDALIAEYANALFTDKQYAKAAFRYRQLVDKNGITKKSVIDFIYKIADTGEDAEVGTLLASLEKRFPGDTEVLQTKGNIALRKNNFPEVLKINQQILQISPENEPALLIWAEIASWQKDYSTSLAYYDRVIKKGKPATDSYFRQMGYREKARVLGWMAKYSQSLSQYDDAVQAYPRNEALKAEAMAKNAYFRNAYRQAVKAYKAWIVAEPNQPEAQFDLGQLYMQKGLWKEALKCYDLILSKTPEHRQATLAKQKIEVLSSMPLLRTGADFLDVKSQWKSINVTYNGFYAALSYPFQEGLTGFLNLDNKSYRFEGLDNSLDKKSISTGIEYSYLPDLLVRANIGYNRSSGVTNDTYTGSFETESQPLDNFHFALGFRQEDVIDNAQTFQSNLQRSRWKGRALYNGYRSWDAGIDYDFANYSDGNTNRTAGADVAAHLLYGTNRLDLTFRLQDYGFSDVNTHNYWTPKSFTTQTAGIEWRHYFNDELFLGVNDTYVTTKYLISFEPRGNVSHQIHGAIHHDWTNRFSTIIEGQYSWASISNYQDKLLKGEIRWFF
jgi:tetratricopeptide (TPR) repeat protein